MSSTGEKMEQQYGKVSKTRLPQILIKAFRYMMLRLRILCEKHLKI